MGVPGPALVISPSPSGTWIVSDEARATISEHETASAATLAAAEQAAHLRITRLLVRDRYQRCRAVALPRPEPR